MAVQVAENQRTFVKNGEPFFYLADTCWSAFTNITSEEWEYYLHIRRNQGYNVIQINILPQWDASETELNFYPFPTKDGKRFQITELKDSYFEHAADMCRMAKEYGFELALVVLWVNYVPDTWASNMMPDNIVPYEFLDEYLKKVDETFSEFEPIYVISGDTDFPGENGDRYYRKASEFLKQHAPGCLQTFHVRGRLQEIPDEFVEAMDFYMYQSGHEAKPEQLSSPYKLAQYFYHTYPAKPVINAEPCYEQMGYSQKMYGRFYPADIRRAAWDSLLSGACAGITYGAHGIYSWHKVHKKFGTGLGEKFDAPNAWNEALQYPGAWDYGFIRYLFELYHIAELRPVDIIANPTEEIRCATTIDQSLYLIYVPNNTCIRLKGIDLEEFDVYTMDLTMKNIGYPECGKRDELGLIQMHKFSRDVLVIMKQRS